MIDLKEGLRTRDLIDLVLPTISIDEYESKIDPDAIVVGFFVDDKEPADDLASFIESGAGDILDTEVSPAPDDDGNYLVFVEFIRDEKLPEHLEYILKTVENLTGNIKWNFTYYGGGDERIPFEKRMVAEKVRLEKNVPVDNDAQMESREFFKESVLDDVILTGNALILKKRNRTMIFEQLALGEEDTMIELLNLGTKAFAMDFKSLKECTAIRKMLGDNWAVYKIDNHFILANNTDTQIMVIK